MSAGGHLYALDGVAPDIHPEAFVAETAVLIGRVVLGARASVWYGAVLRGDLEAIEVGEESSIQDNVIIHTTYRNSPVHVGRGVSVGHQATLHSCTIEDHALIGIGAVVLDEARIGRGSLVAAGTVIRPRTVVPEGVLVAGNPGRVKRALTDDERDALSDIATRYIGYSSAHRNVKRVR